MSAGRIEAYLHSDTTTPNKGGALVKVTSSTDFASRGEAFSNFARKAARFSFACAATCWTDVCNAFPEIEEERIALERELKERIIVSNIVIMAV